MRQRAFFQRVPPIIVERAIVIELVLLILRVAGELEVQPARVVVTENPFPRFAFLPAQLRREAASVNRDSGGQFRSRHFGRRGQDIGEINQIVIDFARRDGVSP